MIDAIKARLWSLLAAKEVSLAMLLDHEGVILWHRGRSVRGRTVDEGEGFPKSHIRQALASGDGLEERDVVVMGSGDGLPLSASALYVKSLLVLPVDETYFLYLDSGSKTAFSDTDREVFRALGGLLRESLDSIIRGASAPGGVGGRSPAMARVRELLARYALEEEPVLLLGESGAGKSYVAECLHRYSGRRGRLVVVHTPSIAEGLFESELFGHARGAYTGAGERTKGLVQEAEGGTLFLDEISEVPPSFQAKLLRFAESRRYRLVGEPSERQADVRLVAASNRDLAEEVRQGRFRSDLYFRLAVLPIVIPPLRERPEDLRELVESHSELLRGKTPGPGFWEAMLGYPWPGNVRELLHVLKRAGILLPGPAIGQEIAGLFVGTGSSEGTSDRMSGIEAALRAGASFWDSAWRAFLDREINRTELRALLQRWQAERGGNLRQLSAALNLSVDDYPRFISALHKYDVHPGRLSD